MNALLIGLIWYFPLFAIMSFIGLRFFDTEKRFKAERLKKNLWEYRVYLLIPVLVFFMVKFEKMVGETNFFNKDYTHMIYGIEGNAHIVFLQSTIQNSQFIHFSSVFYVIFFMWLMVFTTFFLAATSRRDLLRLHTYGLLVNYCVLVLIYLLFSVTVTSMYPPGTAVQPLLYGNDMYRSIVLLVGGFDDCFPSGHISVSTTITLILLLKSDLRRFSMAALATTMLTVFVVLFLGIHWMLDIAGGFLLGLSSYLLIQWPPVFKRLDRMAAFLEEKTRKLASQ